MNMEAQAGAAKNEGEEKQAAFEENVARATAIRQEIAEAAASGDFAKIAELSAEGQQLKSANEGAVTEDHQEGLEMNTEMDAEKAREEAEATRAAALAAAEQARFAQEAAEKAAADQAAAEKLAEEIKSGGGVENEDESVETKEDARTIYGMDEDSALELAGTLGMMPDDSSATHEQRIARLNEYGKLNRTLLDRLSSGQATGFERKMFVATIEANPYGAENIASGIPDSLRGDEEIMLAVAKRSPEAAWRYCRGDLRNKEFYMKLLGMVNADSLPTKLGRLPVDEEFLKDPSIRKMYDEKQSQVDRGLQEKLAAENKAKAERWKKKLAV